MGRPDRSLEHFGVDFEGLINRPTRPCLDDIMVVDQSLGAGKHERLAW